MLARYGGEEFACILPETASEGAFEVGKQLEACVRAERIPHADSTVHDNVTVSVGVAMRQGDGDDTIAHLLADADQQLYRAKAEGRGKALVGLRLGLVPNVVVGPLTRSATTNS